VGLEFGVRLIPVLLGILLSSLLGLITWEYWQARRPWVATTSFQWLDYLLLAFLLLAAIAAGVFVVLAASWQGH
jgi:hypothetical protein